MTQPKDVNDLQTAKNRKSIFAANVSLEDHKKRDARMAELQMREIIEEKRAAIQHIEIKAWHCQECEEYFESKARRELCVERKHTVVLKEGRVFMFGSNEYGQQGFGQDMVGRVVGVPRMLEVVWENYCTCSRCVNEGGGW